MEALFSRYAKDLKRFLSRYLKNNADVDDCTQEAFLHVWQREQQGDLRADLRGYLFTTALNVVRDKRRREQVRQINFHVDLSENSDSLRSREQESDFYWKEALRLIEDELSNLRPSTRKVFLMFHVEHLSYEQIAGRLGISSRTVEREMERAVDHLKSALGGVIRDIANN